MEWVVIPFSRGSSLCRDRTWVSCILRQILYHLSHQGNLLSLKIPLKKKKKQLQKTKTETVVPSNGSLRNSPICLGFPGSSVGKESACNAGDPCWIPGSGRFPWRRARPPIPVFLDFPCGSAGEESTCNAGDLVSIPGLERSPGEGKSLPVPIFWPEEFHRLYMGNDELNSMAQVIYKMKRDSSHYPFLLLTIPCLFTLSFKSQVPIEP